MLISTKGRYALRLMIYMAQTSVSGGTVALRRVAAAESLSLKYLEQLARQMVEAGFLESVRGRNGGYRMAVDPEDVTAGDILRAAEGDTNTVVCEGLEGTCPREAICSTVGFWAGLDKAIDDYVDGVRLSDLVEDPLNRKPFQTLALEGA